MQVRLSTAELSDVYPVFWATATMILTESAAAASFGLIASVAQLGGFAGPYMIGFLNDRTHSLAAGFAFIALVYVVAGGLILGLGIDNPKEVARSSNSAPVIGVAGNRPTYD